MQRYILVIEYIGTNYAGSQKQGRLQYITKTGCKNTDQEKHTKEGICQDKYQENKQIPIAKTIQEELEKQLSTLIKQKTKTIFAGRTDAGVHAKEQYVHFDTNYDCNNEKFIYSLNCMLPDDISAKTIQKAENTFHVQKSAIARWYRYCIKNRQQRSAWDNNCLLVREPLDVFRMNKALSYIEGIHDCSSFKKIKTQNPAKICNIYKAICHKQGDNVYIDIIADRFLYNMIRIIVGTLLMIEKNSLAPEILQDILESKDRTKAGPTLSPDGLTLMKVIYNKENMETAYENLFS